ncbi:hypothetical protein ACF5W4_05200 [Bacillota bacterium Lsc_1132]
MKKRLIINTAQINNDQLILTVDEPISTLQPAEHMLVDSDHFSFIYLMENEEKDYTYIIIPEQVWPVLKEAIKGGIPAFVTFKDERVELPQFQSEMEYLVSNIKGNGNYGEEMAGKVERLF